MLQVDGGYNLAGHFLTGTDCVTIDANCQHARFDVSEWEVYTIPRWSVVLDVADSFGAGFIQRDRSNVVLEDLIRMDISDLR